MRIGDPGTDAVYDRGIDPAIRRVGLMPRRIDRLMHNERIDQKILSELHAAHLVVADLTFARPSVYWEAGYAERKVQVIYTCRRDHLRPRADDKFGNYKIHFDLQTQNIIDWTPGKERQFCEKLERRLRYVLRPILKERAKAEARKREEQTFATLSMAKRREKVVNIAVRQAHRLGFRGRRQDADYLVASFAPRWFAVAQYAAKLSRDGRKVDHTAVVVAVPKLVKTALREVRDTLYRRPLDGKRAEAARDKRKTVVDHAVVLSFAPVSSNMVEETLSVFDRLSTPWPAWSTVTEDRPYPADPSRPVKVHRRKLEVHVLGNIRSETQAREVLNQVILGVKSAGGT